MQNFYFVFPSPLPLTSPGIYSRRFRSTSYSIFLLSIYHFVFTTWHFTTKWLLFFASFSKFFPGWKFIVFICLHSFTRYSFLSFFILNFYLHYLFSLFPFRGGFRGAMKVYDFLNYKMSLGQIQCEFQQPTI